MEKDRKTISKTIWKSFHSMKLGIILLIVIGLLSIIGTVIPQDYALGFYENNYGDLVYKLIRVFSLHKVYTSWWFLGLVSLLAINLLLCSIRRFTSVVNMVRENKDFKKDLANLEKWTSIDYDREEFKEGFKKLGFKKIKEEKLEEGTLLWSHKNSLGYLGSWITHLSLLIIIVFFSYGKVFGFEAFIHGVPGSIREVPETDISIAIEDFDIKFREDFTVDQYISEIKIIRDEKIVDQGQVLVNHPFRTKNLNIYQNGTGWATDVTFYKNGQEYKNKVLYQGEFFIEDEDKIALQFINFYPDFIGEGGDLGTKSPFPNHPVMLYAIFYDGYRVDMNIAHMGEELEYKEYKFKIDQPQMFTLLQIVRDPGTKGALLGGALLLIGIFLAFYINPKKLLIYLNEDSCKIYWKTYKNKDNFKDEVNKTFNIGGLD